MSLQNSVAEVETLQRKQAQLEENLEAHLDQLDEVQRLAQIMVQEKHYDSDNIRAKSRALGARYEAPPTTRFSLRHTKLSGI